MKTSIHNPKQFGHKVLPSCAFLDIYENSMPNSSIVTVFLNLEQATDMRDELNALITELLPEPMEIIGDEEYHELMDSVPDVPEQPMQCSMMEWQGQHKCEDCGVTLASGRWCESCMERDCGDPSKYGSV